MDGALPFGEVLEAVDQLSTEEQTTLLDIARRRLAEHGRKRLIAEAREAQIEFAQGGGRVSTVDELMDEILA